VEARHAATTAGGADAYIRALGGASNLRAVDACATRLRLELANRDAATPMR
jgi:phosphotransferase system IIB component